MPKIVFATVGKDDPLKVVAQAGDGAPRVIDGYGRVEIVDRANRQSVTRWLGAGPVSISVPILLDGYRASRSVEGDIRALEQMAGRKGENVYEQRVITCVGPGQLVPHDGLDFVITGLDWGDEIVSRDGLRTRQAATVTLTQWVEPVTEQPLSKRHSGGTHARSYVVKKGDTLRLISRKVFGSPDRWRQIMTLNKIDDPRIVGTVGKRKGCAGTTLQMPR
jgi:hypothetical protein